MIFTLLRVHNLKKFDNTCEDLEDLISIGTIGLIKAIESFSLNKGTKLATFTARCIENEILMHLRSLKKTRKDVSLHDPIGTDKEAPIGMLKKTEILQMSTLAFIRKEKAPQLFEVLTHCVRMKLVVCNVGKRC